MEEIRHGSLYENSLNFCFDADDVPANPEFYKLLPKCCKKPEDGGIPPKKPSTQSN
jgi:hypothetical protein